MQQRSKQQVVDEVESMEIRELSLPDRTAAIEIWESTGLTRPWNDPIADFDRAVAGSTSTVLGAVDTDGLAATVMVGHDGHRGWIYYLAVVAPRQGQGLGRQLMEAGERWLSDQGAIKVNLMVRDTNADALSFYERLGYEDAQTVVVARWLRPPAGGER